MKLKPIFLASMLAFASHGVLAGDFYTIPNTSPSATLVGNNPSGSPFVSNNTNSDRFYIPTTGISWVSGFEDLIPSSLSYNAIATSGGTPRAVTGSGVLSLLDYHVSEDIELNGEAIGDAYDFVFRDSRDGQLVFGSRVLLGTESYHDVGDGELNYLYRNGFSGFSVATAWTYISDNDLKLYQAALTSDYSYGTTVSADPDSVRLKSDISVAEGNPFSALFLIKTNAEFYTFSNNAFAFFQAGEEGQEVVGNAVAGFAPSATAPVPEPETYAMMLAGLGLMGFATRRRRNS